jgi:hypothetical protein
MKKSALFFAVLAMTVAIGTAPVFAVTPVNPEDPALVMYANQVYAQGNVVPVKMGPYNGWTHAQRLCPENALGEFDAMPGVASFNERFFGVASRAYVQYSFDGSFGNVDGVPDIEFCEVTWGSGNSWHVEAVLVYLIGATVRDENGDVAPYAGNDNEIGYYAGIAWNRTGVAYVSEARRIEIAESYLSGVDRDYDSNEFYYSGTFGWTQFNLPSEVVCAEGIYLVDITAAVYAEGGAPSTYTNGAGSLVTALNCRIDESDDVLAVAGYNGNTDGYDLDAIRVYRCPPCIGDDTATGSGTAILPKGTWFMYNQYIADGSPQCFDLQAGNPKDGVNIVGEYCITDNADDTFTATYEFDDYYYYEGWRYDIVVGDEHLGISQSMDFTAVPGLDDNQDWGELFEADVPFYIFAHFEVEYR